MDIPYRKILQLLIYTYTLLNITMKRLEFVFAQKQLVWGQLFCCVWWKTGQQHFCSYFCRSNFAANFFFLFCFFRLFRLFLLQQQNHSSDICCCCFIFLFLCKIHVFERNLETVLDENKLRKMCWANRMRKWFNQRQGLMVTVVLMRWMMFFFFFLFVDRIVDVFLYGIGDLLVHGEFDFLQNGMEFF